ncbi:thymidine phosphorylase [Tropicibacter naphthalenivorans]|uniref:Thymidine phosphorylase n=1 Tax=Tropicibacter naphthalenivorans TaxID=441103 RepID=A0A0P1G0W9_9RHOB|nr:thymidine phosphorylase [Tropicibacter naphthalenivorans]CUH75214.1 Thymidine phosphorylase [Tropicibacter naphthalenivorans]SMC45557.1 thymidine phosphorylase [Tropicibacter naphthalenivorans]
MDARSVIACLRRGEEPSPKALAWFAQGLAEGVVSGAQGGAFAMGVCLRGLSEAGRVALTLAMRDSGRVLDWDMDAPVIDKHSTGGVGDCVSLVLAPALAACGVYVPMISGRGLGHTGGTLDKLEAIPGYNVSPDEARFRRIIGDVGCAIVSASADIAPADKRLYAIRDVTATVESLDLITASILSKKLAAGLQSLVLDVKVGSGAFMKTDEEARALAQALVGTANAAGCPTTALITDMSQPLCPALGNALEVDAVMQVLTGGAEGPLLELSIALGAELLKTANIDDGEAKLRKAIARGYAAERFGKMIYELGGPRHFVEDWRRFLPEATVIREVPAPESGVVTAIDGEALGLAVVDLGGGRRVETDAVDPAVGLTEVVRLGDKIAKGQPLARVHAAREGAAEQAIQAVQKAITLGNEAPKAQPLVKERVA